MTRFSESHVEEAALEWLSGLGYAVLYGPDISPDGSAPERISYDQIFKAALASLSGNRK